MIRASAHITKTRAKNYLLLLNVNSIFIFVWGVLGVYTKYMRLLSIAFLNDDCNFKRISFRRPRKKYTNKNTQQWHFFTLSNSVFVFVFDYHCFSYWFAPLYDCIMVLIYNLKGLYGNMTHYTKHAYCLPYIANIHDYIIEHVCVSCTRIVCAPCIFWAVTRVHIIALQRNVYYYVGTYMYFVNKLY